MHGQDQAHEKAARIWKRLTAHERELVTTSLVLAETHGLIARRLGVEAGLGFLDAFSLARGRRVVWVDEEMAGRATQRWLERYRNLPLSLTDAASFETMERLGLREAFAFDDAFRRVGYRLVS